MTNNDKKPVVLVVDDMPVNLKVLVNILTPDYTVVVAISGQEALLVVEDEPPDLILMDIMMPEMDGYEVLHRLKTNENTREIPVIFVTARTEAEDETRELALGAVDFILKPINKNDVLALVKTHLLRHESQVSPHLVPYVTRNSS